MSGQTPQAAVITIEGDRVYLDDQDAALCALAIGLHHLPTMLARCALKFTEAGEGVVLLDKLAAEALGLWKTGKPPAHDDPKMRGWAGLAPARDAGWNVTGLAPWMSFHAEDRPSVRVCVWPWLDKDTAGTMADDGLVVFAANLTRFAAVMGTAFHTHPGVVGLSLLRDRTARRLRTEPYWKPHADSLPSATAQCEADYRWLAPAPLFAEGKFVHAYDARRAYVGAAQTADLSTSALEFTHRTDFDPHFSGYWQIERPVWNEPRLPHPAGYPTEGMRPGQPQWVTTPTMCLLAELADHGMLAMPSVRQAYIGRGRDQDRGLPTTRVLRGWAQTINRAALDTIESEADAAVHKAIKHVYQQGIGQLATPSGRVWRPDWRHTVIALARANLFRKMLRVGMTEGRWPVGVLVDSIRYAHDEPDATAACPVGLRLGIGLGEFDDEKSWDAEAFLAGGDPL